MKKILTYFILAGILLIGCETKENAPRPSQTGNALENGWTVPIDQLVLSQLQPDRIPSIDAPHFELLNDHNLASDETAYVFRKGNTIKVYPQNILWHHEIVNDNIGMHYYAVTFCPLTGSALAWNREVDGAVTEFGVSGHLFNENLIPYDRNSNSFWSQMRLQGMKGSHAGDKLEGDFLLFTTGTTIKQAYPNALVLVDSSEHQCDSLCHNFKHGHQLDGLSGVNAESDYFGIVDVGLIKDPQALLFSYTMFEDSIKVYQTQFRNNKVIVAGSEALKFIVAFIDNTSAPNAHFHPVQNQLPTIMKDMHGNLYDLTGLVVSGPATGFRLPSPDAYKAHAFAWELFFGENVELFE